MLLTWTHNLHVSWPRTHPHKLTQIYTVRIIFLHFGTKFSSVCFLLDPCLRISWAIIIKERETYTDSTPKSEKEAEQEHVVVVLKQIHWRDYYFINGPLTAMILVLFEQTMPSIVLGSDTKLCRRQDALNNSHFRLRLEIACLKLNLHVECKSLWLN